jgi:hypothetical protein
MDMKKQEIEEPQRITAASRLLTASWLILAALLVVFAADLNQWAIAAESPVVSQRIAPLTQALASAAERLGISGTRQAAEISIHHFYDEPVVIGAREAVSEMASPPPVQQVDAAVAASGDEAAQNQLVAAAEAGQFSPTRILLVGDSSIQAGLGTKLERRLEDYDDVTVDRFGLHSTGIARPDYFDWSEKLAELMGEFNPDLVIAYWGDNDCQGLSTKEGEFLAHFGTDEWDVEYGRRIESIVKQVSAAGSNMVILGMPIMRSKSFSKRIERLNGVVEQATEAAGGYYLPTWDMCADADGNYMASVEFQGKTRIIRASDGIHLSTHGSAYVAYQICKELEKTFELAPPAEE